MTSDPLPIARMGGDSDGYGHARMPRGATVPEPDKINHVGLRALPECLPLYH